MAFAADLGVVYFHFRAGTQTDALLAAAVADEDEVLQYGVGNGSGGVVAAVVVALHQAVAVVAQCGFGFLVSHEAGAFAVPAFGPVEGVVATAYGYEVAHVYRAAEELKAVIGTFVGLAVVHDGTVAYAVERDTVGFVLFIEGKAGVFQTNVLQRARVVGIIVAAVNGTAYFRTSLAAFGIGVGASADVDASPCARLFFFAGHYDGFVRRAYGVDFTALLHEDVVCDVIVDGDNLHAFLYVERGTFFYDVFAAQLVGVSGSQGHVGGDGTFQYRTVFDFIAVSVAAVTVIVVVVVAAASGEDRHSGYKGQRVEFPFHCFHNSIVLVVISNLSVCHSD